MLKTIVLASLAFFGSAAQACFLTGEQTSGMNKICYYNCLSGTKAITVSSVSLCPLSISQALPAGPVATALASLAAKKKI